MNNMTIFAEAELDRIGLTENSDEMNKAMRDHILTMVAAFSDEDHSGFSASYALGLLERLLAFKPLTPLTGEDDEWMDVAEDAEQGKLYQNKRHSTVFKNDHGAYDIDGIVFYDWYTDEETGEKFKSYFTSYNSRVPVEFPYDVPNKPIYKERESEAE